MSCIGTSSEPDAPDEPDLFLETSAVVVREAQRDGADAVCKNRQRAKKGKADWCLCNSKGAKINEEGTCKHGSERTKFCAFKAGACVPAGGSSTTMTTASPLESGGSSEATPNASKAKKKLKALGGILVYIMKILKHAMMNSEGMGSLVHSAELALDDAIPKPSLLQEMLGTKLKDGVSAQIDKAKGAINVAAQKTADAAVKGMRLAVITPPLLAAKLKRRLRRLRTNRTATTRSVLHASLRR